MICKICGKKVTRTQLKHAEAIKTPTDYAHADCIDDLCRHPGDAYHRERKE